MCGIVTFWGQGEGVSHVLEALHLLQYRAPDSAGIAVVGPDGCFNLRRSVGGPANLARHISNRPLYAPTGTDGDDKAFAFRLLGAHVAAREAVDETVRLALNAALQERLPQHTYKSWREAWLDELSANVPGHAFATAARHFQETFPGLANQLEDGEWERIGRLTAQALGQMVMGHGRWAMVGAVSEENAHPLTDHSQTRIVCENGSHNARLMLGLRAEQELWWRARSVAADQTVHRSENTTEVVAFEWERMRIQLEEEAPPPGAVPFLSRLDACHIDDVEERALRLALWRMRDGNAHACALYSRHRPDSLYVSSHHKPIAIIMRAAAYGDVTLRQQVMIASDVNAGLMLWSRAEVDAAAEEMRHLQAEARLPGGNLRSVQAAIEQIISRFAVHVIFLDAELFRGEELLARIGNRVQVGTIVVNVDVTRYDGTPLAVKATRVTLNPVMVGKGAFDTYVESHIAELPDVLDDLVRTYVTEEGVRLDSAWRDGALLSPGLNVSHLQARFGQDLARLERIVLIGEGSSWRDGQVAAPLFRDLLPRLAVNVYRPVEVLNLGMGFDPAHDLAVEISWSGTTDSLLKVDAWLAESDVLRLAITGRVQSDLGRRTAGSGGTLDVRSGVEVSVATVKGFEAVLMTLNLLALQMAELCTATQTDVASRPSHSARREFSRMDLLSISRYVRALVNDEARRRSMRDVAERCGGYNKVVVVGDTPVNLEGELKIEELAQVVALALDFHAASLRPLIERSALVDADAARALFIFNVTSPEAHGKARPLIAYLQSLDLFCIVHSTPHDLVADWQAMSNTAVFVTPQVSPHLQPLLDAPFFFDLAVALAYARGLSPAEIDSPRNLAKSVTTTGAERRSAVEARLELRNVTLQEFAQGRRLQTSWNRRDDATSGAAFRAAAPLSAALGVFGEAFPAWLDLESNRRLLIVADTEATENGAQMAAATWQELLGIELAVERRFNSSLRQRAAPTGTACLRLVRDGAVLTLRDAHTIALPSDMPALQLELLSALYLTGLATRLARQRSIDVAAWQSGLAQMPFLVSELLSDRQLAAAVRNALSPYTTTGYDKLQIIGGGQDYVAAASIARSLRMRGFVAEALYTDSAWHGPLATVGGPDAEHDTLILILATDPLFQAAALVDTQVYRTRNAPVLLVVPEGNEDAETVHGVEASVVIALPGCPRPFLPVANATFGEVVARQMPDLSS